MQVPVDYGTGPGTLTTGRQGTPPPPPPPAPEDPATAAARLYANDPIYLMSVAQTKQERADAASLYLEQLKPLLLQYGDPALARATLEKIAPTLEKYLGYKPDLTSYYAQFTGSTNPDGSFSTLAQIARGAKQANTNTTESFNKQNLFYGGHYGKAMRDNEYNRLKSLSEAANNIFGQLGGLGRDFQGSINQAQRSDIGAAQTAYGNGLQESINGASTAQAPPAKPPPPPPAPYVVPPSLVAEQKATQAAAQPIIKPPPKRPTKQSKVYRPF